MVQRHDHRAISEPMTDDTSVGSPGDDPAELDPFDGPAWDGPRRRTSRPREAVAAAAAEPAAEVRIRRERRRRSKYSRRRRRRRFLLAGGIVALAVVAAGAWLLYSGLHARRDLEAVRSEVRQLRSQIASGDLSGARTTAAALRRQAR